MTLYPYMWVYYVYPLAAYQRLVMEGRGTIRKNGGPKKH
jgi:hypothetical protein